MKRNLMDELTEGIDTLAMARQVNMNNIKHTINIPNHDDKKLLVWLDERFLCFEFPSLKGEGSLVLDKRILPDLVDALIKLQNNEK